MMMMIINVYSAYAERNYNDMVRGHEDRQHVLQVEKSVKSYVNNYLHSISFHLLSKNLAAVTANRLLTSTFIYFRTVDGKEKKDKKKKGLF